MKLSEVKTILEKLEDVNFSLPNGQMVPIHFHVTEVGIITKKYTMRSYKMKVSLN